MHGIAGSGLKVIAGFAAATVAVEAAVAFVSAVGPQGGQSETVTRVIDGDTIEVQLAGRSAIVRLLNIDTPETKHPEKAVQCLGPEATAFLTDLLPAGQAVTLDFDIERSDEYGRLLAGVRKNGTLVNAAIAEAGLGVAVLVKPNTEHYAEVKAAQERAQKAAVGLYDADTSCTLPARVTSLVHSYAAATSTPPEDLQIGSFDAISTDAARLRDLMDALPHTDETAWMRAAWDVKRLSAQVRDIEDAASTLKAEVKRRQDEAAAKVAAEAKKKADEAAAKKAAQERAAREAAEQAAREAAEREAEEQAAQQAAADPDPVHVPDPEPGRTPDPDPLPEPRAGSGDGEDEGHDASPYPGYTGPRCYAPGGRAEGRESQPRSTRQTIAS
ncbi:thermonuclease family protein [Schaalia sp. 19OD2882]|uniref:thermonuclease family protein n=1 Tax=Schaalia sp. 19OD2882 TaxID=2794089 RepID=UPI001C1EF4CB|nr:thermonuclease family protein [Schaalia sp. 19OD2882]QWW20224.1 thermonuclease family protein [Schaalia sp. 19OD2882]